VTLAGSATVVQIAEACAKQGVTAVPLGSDGSVNPLSWAKDDAMKGTIAVLSNFVSTDTSIPATKDFQAAMTKYAPKLGDLQNQYAAQTWIAGEMLRKAIEASGSSTVTPQSVKTGLYTFKNETLGGIIPPVTFTKDQPTINLCYMTAVLQNGKWTTPNGLTPKCAPKEMVAPVIASLK
jgi:branched-chain amino acid transport system substrate-binding protein